MTDIIRMAEEAEAWSLIDHDGIAALERFAALVVAEKEQQMIRDGWRQCAEGQSTTQYCAIAEAAIRARGET